MKQRSAITLIFFVLSICTSYALGETQSWKDISNGETIGPYTKLNNKIICGEKGSPSMKKVNSSAFQVFGSTAYGRDDKRIYYPLQSVCIDFPSDQNKSGYCFCKEYIVKKANPAEFKYLGNEYATDGKHVYFRGELIPKADGKTAQLIIGPEYFYGVKDSKNVYIYGGILKFAEAATFQYLGVKNEGTHLFKDSRNQWEWSPPEMPILVEQVPHA